MGEEAFHSWLASPIPGEKVREPALMRLFFFGYLPPQERIAAVEQHLASLEGLVATLELFLRSAQGFTRRSLRAFAGNDALLRPVAQPLEVPLQIVVGEHECTLLCSAAEEWQRREPGSVLELISGAGHCANMDNPGLFNDRLLAFLERHRRPLTQGDGLHPTQAVVA